MQMVVGQIATPNSKWQIVIPKKVRDELGVKKPVAFNIFAKGKKVVMAPIEMVKVKNLPWENRRKKLDEAMKELKGSMNEAQYQVWRKDKNRIKKRNKNKAEELRNAW